MRYLLGLFFVTAAVLFSLTLGCEGYGARYELHVDPAFTADEQEKIFAAADSWSAVVPVRFDIMVGHCDGVHDGQICIHSSTRALTQTECSGEDAIGCDEQKYKQELGMATERIDGGEIYLATSDIIPEYFQRVAAHEIGHAMGLVHAAAGTVMYPVENDNQAATPSKEDVSAWHALR